MVEKTRRFVFRKIGENMSCAQYLLMIIEVFSLSKNFTTILLVMRAIHRHTLQHFLNGRVWTFSNSWSTFTRSQVFTFFTELMSIIMATVSIPLFFRKPRDIFAFETLQTFDGIFKKFVFKNGSCRHFSFQQTSKFPKSLHSIRDRVMRCKVEVSYKDDRKLWKIIWLW